MMESPLLHRQKFSLERPPVLEAAYYVDPFFLDTQCNLTERNKLKQATKMVFGDDLSLTAVMEQFSFFKGRDKIELTDPDCLCDCTRLTALAWWKNWGYAFPNLQKVALLLSALRQANGPAERAWNGRAFLKTVPKQVRR